MSIPVSIDPLGTLGASPMPPGFRPLAYVEATNDSPYASRLPWPGLINSAFNQATDTLIIDGGCSTAMSVYGSIFRYLSSNSRGIGAGRQSTKVVLQNGEGSASGLMTNFNPGRMYHFIAAPDKESIDEITRVKEFEAFVAPDLPVWSTGALLGMVERQRSGVAVETIVAAERIPDGALGLVSLTTGVFLKV